MDILEQFSTHPVFYSLSLTLLHFIWQGLAIAAFLYVVLKLVPKSYADIRYCSGMAAMFLNIAVPTATFFWLYESSATATLPLATTHQAITENGLFASHELAQAVFTEVLWRDYLVSYFPVISVIWLIGVSYLAANLITEMFKVNRLTRTAVFLPEVNLQTLFNRLKQRIDGSTNARLLISLKAEVPMVIGYLKPVVLVPVGMVSGLSYHQLEMLLAHELAHVRRHDYLVNFLQTFVEIVLFYHPCVKWVSKQMRIEREYCCDDIAIHHCGDAITYAHTLTDAESLRGQAIPQMAMAATAGDLKSRVFRLTKVHSCQPQYGGQWIVGAVVLMFTTTLLVSQEVAAIHNSTSVDKVVEQDQESFIKQVATGTLTLENQAHEEITSAPVQAEEEQAQTASNSTQASPSIENSVSVSEPEEVAQQNLEPASVKQQADTVMTETASLAVEEDAITEAVEPAPASEALAQATSQEPAQVAEADVDESKVAESNVNTVTEQAEPQLLASRSVETQLPAEPEPVTDSLPAQAEPAQENTEAVAEPQSVAAKLVVAQGPKYPRQAMIKGYEQDVKVTFTVNRHGFIEDVEFVDADTRRYFKTSVERALKQWRYEPATVDGEAVNVKISKIFSFKDPSRSDDNIMISTGSHIARARASGRN